MDVHRSWQVKIASPDLKKQALDLVAELYHNIAFMPNCMQARDHLASVHGAITNHSAITDNAVANLKRAKEIIIEEIARWEQDNPPRR